MSTEQATSVEDEEPASDDVVAGWKLLGQAEQLAKEAREQEQRAASSDDADEADAAAAAAHKHATEARALAHVASDLIDGSSDEADTAELCDTAVKIRGAAEEAETAATVARIAANKIPRTDGEGASDLPANIDDALERYVYIESLDAVLDTRAPAGTDLMTMAQARNRLAPCRVLVAGHRAQKEVPLIEVWREHPRRRSFRKLVFEPAQTPLSGVPSRDGGGRWDYNIWPGIALTPSSERSDELFLAHLRDVICRGDEAAASWVLQFLAAIVQRPDEPVGTALVLIGRQGAGKDVVGRAMREILGPSLHTTISTTDQLTGRFNYLHEGRLLIQAEEAFFAGDPRHVGRIKNLITSKTNTIERKGIDTYTVSNYARFLLTSNERWVVPAGGGERRFMVLDVADTHCNDRKYFNDLHRQMFAQGGCERLLYRLLFEVEVDYDFLREPLATDALRDQQLESLRAEENWLSDLLLNGALPGDVGGIGVAESSALYRSYAQTQRRPSEVKLGRFLARYGVSRRRLGRNRVYHHAFPPLAEMRAKFVREHLVTPPDWGEVESWQPESAEALQ